MESRPISLLNTVMLLPAWGHGARPSDALQRQQRLPPGRPQQSPLQRRPRRPYFSTVLMPVTRLWSGARSSEAPPAEPQCRWRTQGMCKGSTWGAIMNLSPRKCPMVRVAGAHGNGAERTPR